ncbi:MAG: hypothetical protein ACOYJ2_06870 [Rickettsiales bacterium]
MNIVDSLFDLELMSSCQNMKALKDKIISEYMNEHAVLPHRPAPQGFFMSTASDKYHQWQNRVYADRLEYIDQHREEIDKFVEEKLRESDYLDKEWIFEDRIQVSPEIASFLFVKHSANTDADKERDRAYKFRGLKLLSTAGSGVWAVLFPNPNSVASAGSAIVDHIASSRDFSKRVQATWDKIDWSVHDLIGIDGTRGYRLCEDINGDYFLEKTQATVYYDYSPSDGRGQRSREQRVHFPAAGIDASVDTEKLLDVAKRITDEGRTGGRA